MRFVCEIKDSDRLPYPAKNLTSLAQYRGLEHELHCFGMVMK